MSTDPASIPAPARDAAVPAADSNPAGADIPAGIGSAAFLGACSPAAGEGAAPAGDTAAADNYLRCHNLTLDSAATALDSRPALTLRPHYC